MFERMQWILLVGTVLAGTQVFAGTITGSVTTESDLPLAGVSIEVIDDEGNAQITQTQANGFYQISGLDSGWYTIYILEPAGFELVNPACGFHTRNIGVNAMVVANFRLKPQSSGVVVEFGSPGGNFSFITRALNLVGNTYAVSVYATNLQAQSPDFPIAISITGYWHVPGYGAILVKNQNGNAVGNYLFSGMNISVVSLPQNRTRIILEHSSWPYFSLDGELAQLGFEVVSGLAQIQAKGGQIGFCIESVQFRQGLTIHIQLGRSFLGSLK